MKGKTKRLIRARVLPVPVHVCPKADNSEGIRQVVERLQEISADMVGSARMLLDDEIRVLEVLGNG